MAKLKMKKPERSYSGNRWLTNRTNKKHLRQDFDSRCAYCDDWDCINGSARCYHVEHFAPKDKFPELKFEYSNLLYACPYCNGSKSNKWPSEDASINVVDHKGFLDPCKDEYYKNLHRNEDGSIGYDTELGQYIYNELNLGLKRHQILYKVNRLNDLRKQLKNIIERKKANGEDTKELERISDKIGARCWDMHITLNEN